MSRKSKKITTTITSREDLENLVGEFAKWENNIAAMKAELEARIIAVRAEYEAAMAAAGVERDICYDDIFAWAQLHPEQFAGRKSVELLQGVIGFRTGTPKVVWPKGTTDATAVELLQAKLLPEYIRTKHEPDKEKILAEFAADDPVSEQWAVTLGKAGIRIRQDERFYIDPKEEKVAK